MDRLQSHLVSLYYIVGHGHSCFDRYTSLLHLSVINRSTMCLQYKSPEQFTVAQLNVNVANENCLNRNHSVRASTMKHYGSVMYCKCTDFVLNQCLSILFVTSTLALTNTLTYYKSHTLQIFNACILEAPRVVQSCIA